MKNPIPIHLGVEDALSEWVLRRVLRERRAAFIVGGVFGRTGFGYLRKQVRAFNNAAKGCPFLVLTDLDKVSCPPELIASWLNCPKHPHFLLRVAVREVESWLLGDAKGLGHFLGLRQIVRIAEPEMLAEPKQELLKLAFSSPRRAVREALVWHDGGTGRFFQGPDYNGALAPFVADSWNLVEARTRCRSLARLLLALERLESTYDEGGANADSM